MNFTISQPTFLQIVAYARLFSTSQMRPHVGSPGPTVDIHGKIIPLETVGPGGIPIPQGYLSQPFQVYAGRVGTPYWANHSQMFVDKPKGYFYKIPNKTSTGDPIKSFVTWLCSVMENEYKSELIAITRDKELDVLNIIISDDVLISILDVMKDVPMLIATIENNFILINRFINELEINFQEIQRMLFTHDKKTYLKILELMNPNHPFVQKERDTEAVRKNIQEQQFIHNSDYVPEVALVRFDLEDSAQTEENLISCMILCKISRPGGRAEYIFENMERSMMGIAIAIKDVVNFQPHIRLHCQRYIVLESQDPEYRDSVLSELKKSLSQYIL